MPSCDKDALSYNATEAKYWENSVDSILYTHCSSINSWIILKEPYNRIRIQMGIADNHWLSALVYLLVWSTDDE